MGLISASTAPHRGAALTRSIRSTPISTAGHALLHTDARRNHHKNSAFVLTRNPQIIIRRRASAWEHLTTIRFRPRCFHVKLTHRDPWCNCAVDPPNNSMSEVKVIAFGMLQGVVFFLLTLWPFLSILMRWGHQGSQDWTRDWAVCWPIDRCYWERSRRVTRSKAMMCMWLQWKAYEWKIKTKH